MTRINTLKTNFSAGELSPRLAGRPDLAAYRDGARRLRNVTVHPTGGLSRRPGLQRVQASPARRDSPPLGCVVAVTIPPAPPR